MNKKYKTTHPRLQEFKRQLRLGDVVHALAGIIGYGPQPPASEEEPTQLQKCSHGTPFRYECEECVGECELLAPPLARQGWRHFSCDDCGHAWAWPTRDHRSPSNETCPKCFADTHPYDKVSDPSIPVDESGNITIPYNTEYLSWVSGDDGITA
jgi:hypothetical protein